MSPQCQLILDHLRRGNGITTLQAMRDFGCCRLSERIREIEREGWVILHNPIRTESGKRVMRYSLVGKRLEQIPLLQEARA